MFPSFYEKPDGRQNLFVIFLITGICIFNLITDLDRFINYWIFFLKVFKIIKMYKGKINGKY